MQPITLTNEEQKTYLLFRLKQYEEEYARHKLTEETLLSKNSEDPLIESLINSERDSMKILDDSHAEIKAKLDRL